MLPQVPDREDPIFSSLHFRNSAHSPSMMDNGCMSGRFLRAGVAVFLAMSVSAVSLAHQNASCKQRGATYRARVEKLKREAHEKLKIGTKKDAAIRFFQENGVPVTFSGKEASGTIYTKGCAPSGCGSDDALIGLRVKVDEAGTVVAEPVVGAIYTNCL